MFMQEDIETEVVTIEDDGFSSFANDIIVTEGPTEEVCENNNNYETTLLKDGVDFVQRDGINHRQVDLCNDQPFPDSGTTRLANLETNETTFLNTEAGEMLGQAAETSGFEPTGSIPKEVEIDQSSYYIEVDASAVMNLKAGTQYTLIPMNEVSGSYDNNQECVCIVQGSEDRRRLIDNATTTEKLATEVDDYRSDVQNTWMNDNNEHPNQLAHGSEQVISTEQMDASLEQMQAPSYAQLKPVSPLSEQVMLTSWDNSTCNVNSLLSTPTATQSCGRVLRSSRMPCELNCSHNRRTLWSNTSWSHYEQDQGCAANSSQVNQTELERAAAYQRSSASNVMLNSNGVPRVKNLGSGPFIDGMPCYIPYTGRENHNEKERKRRTRIKRSCQSLRALVPGLTEKTDKATVFELTVQYLAFLKRNASGNIDKDFVERYSVY